MHGQLLPLSQNTALFSLLGTVYGGNGKSNFALPDIQGRGVVHPGQGQGLSLVDLGQTGGTEFLTLIQSEMPLHNHVGMAAGADPAEANSPAPDRSLARSAPGNAWQSDSAQNLVQKAPQALGLTGGNLPHNNMSPYLTFTFCIALQGVFPPRG